MTLAIASKQVPDSASKAKREVARDAPSKPSQMRSSFPAFFIQRKPTCACSGGCPRCKEHPIQTKLRISEWDDRYEQEAERVAEQVMRMPEPQTLQGETPLPASFMSTRSGLQRRCACGGTPNPNGECTECRTSRLGLQRESTDQSESFTVPTIVHDVLRSPGRPLSPETRTFMESGFGHDFGRVRVHTDARAAESARAINALAYTVGRDIVFGAGQYMAGSAEGKRLLAHELAHVLQQEAGRTSAVQRQYGSAQSMQGAMNDPRIHPSGAPSAAACAPPPHCPPNFCQPYSSASYATSQRTRLMLTLMAGIAAAVDSRVVPLWREHLLGGSSPKNLTSRFALDFTNSRETADTTRFLLTAMRASLQASPPTFPTGTNTVTEDFTSRLGPDLRAIDDPNSPEQMNFAIPGEVAGNLAGGIGKDQTTCRAGAMPSPFNDERAARVTATITRQPNGDLLVQPSITFTVRDTIDLCPGDCGTEFEQLATVVISQFEATGISGDVPFTVEFAAPAALLMPFTVRPAAPRLPGP